MTVERNPDTHVGIRVLIDGLELPCDPETNTPGILSGLKVTWGRQSRLEKVPASTCDFQIVDPDGGDDYTMAVYYNAPVEVQAIAPDGTRYRVFGGFVSDLSLTHEAGTDAVLSVTAVDPTAKLSAVMVGDNPWPAQTTQQRRSAILATAPSGTLNWPALPASVTDGTVPQARLDVDNQSLWDVVSDFLWGIALVPWPIAYGSQLQAGLIQTAGRPDPEKPALDTRDNRRIPYAQFLSIGRQNSDGTVTRYDVPTVVLDACDIDLEGTEFTASPDDIRQTRRITWGGSQEEDEGGTGVEVVASSTGGRGDDTRTFDVTSCVPSAGYARNVATKWAYHMAEWFQFFDAPWGVGALVLDPDTVTEMDNFHLAMVRLLEQTTRASHVVMLQSVPSWAPWRDVVKHTPEPNVFGYLQGGVYEYTDGRWRLEMNISAECALEGELAPPLVLTVSPGDDVPYPIDSTTVTFVPDPSTPWAPGEVATFTDGPFGWDGTQWVVAGTQPIIVTPGDVVDLPHTDARLQPYPSSPWGADEYATFSDGPYRWAGSAWVAWVPAVVVRPGDVVDVPHDYPRLVADPTTRWSGAQYATFSDGPYRWTGTGWQAVVVVRPGDTKTFSVKYTLAVPEPTGRWDVDDYATFTDGRYRWSGTAWVAYVIWTTKWTNLVRNPRPASTSLWRVSAGDSVTFVPDDGGLGALEYLDATANGALYGDPSDNFRPALGQWLAAGYDLVAKDAATAAAMRLRLQGYSGTTTTGAVGPQPIGTTAYQRVVDAAQVDAYAEAGYVRVLIWPANVTPGAATNGFRVRKAVVAIANTEAEARAAVASPWDGDTADTEAADYSWTGEANASSSIMRVPGVVPGSTVDAPHDDDAVVPNPTTAWGEDDYATFSDGLWRWDGEAWVLSPHAPITVRPYDTVTVAHTDARVEPDPTTAWSVPGTTGRMAPAWFSDGTWSWQGVAWAQVYVIGPGDTSTQDPSSPTTTPYPYAAWALDEYATLRGTRYRWTGTAWVAWVPSWEAAPEGVAWQDVPAGTSWTEWNGSI